MIKLVIIAANWNIPIADFLEAARKLLNKQCAKCDEVNRILRKIHELGPKQAELKIRNALK